MTEEQISLNQLQPDKYNKRFHGKIQLAPLKYHHSERLHQSPPQHLNMQKDLKMQKHLSNPIDDRIKIEPVEIVEGIFKDYWNAPVKSFGLNKIQHKANLVPTKEAPNILQIMAKGQLLGTNNTFLNLHQYQNIEFQGNFVGIFEKDNQKYIRKVKTLDNSPKKLITQIQFDADKDETITEQKMKPNKHYEYQFKKEEKGFPIIYDQFFYFEGVIKNLKVLSYQYKVNLDDKGNELHKNDLTRLLQGTQSQTFNKMQTFKGYFYGFFFKPQKTLVPVEQYVQVDLKPKETKFFIEEDKKGDPQYFIPAVVNFDIRKITQINLEKSLANLQAILKLQIFVDPNIHFLLIDEDGKFKEKHKLTVDFHRSRPFNLSFYNQDDYEDESEETQYEWQDDWQGVDKTCQWNQETNIMSYEIRTNFTAEIDNSFGIFYAPFNLNILRIVMDIHSIKIKSPVKCKLNITCCDFSDFNKSKNCTPYINFNTLKLNQLGRSHEEIFQMQIDRLTKINRLQFIDQGEFSIADNRLYLFPYHKRVFVNKNTLASNLSWIFGTASRSSLIKWPEVITVKEGYQRCLKDGKKEYKSLEIQKWQFVHIEIPLFKYPVIDMIRIFVPITILSLISLLIFWQQNGKNSDNITVLASRIGSGIGILFAYVALIPTIRQNLPPSPSFTLVEVLIYMSTIPNFLAIISVFAHGNEYVSEFFNSYLAYSDPLFIISFSLCLFSLVILIIMMAVYSRKDYKTNFTIKKFQPSTLQKARAPYYMRYMDKLKERKDIDIKEGQKMKQDYQKSLKQKEKSHQKDKKSKNSYHKN